MSDRKKIYAVFGPNQQAFYDWAAETLKSPILRATVREIETADARYKFGREVHSFRGYSLDGIVVLKGFNMTAGSWDEVRLVARLGMVS